MFAGKAILCDTCGTPKQFFSEGHALKGKIMCPNNHSIILEDNTMDSTVLAAMSLAAEDIHAGISYEEILAETNDEIVVEPKEILSNGVFVPKQKSNGLFIIKCKDCGSVKEYAKKDDGGLIFPPTLVCTANCGA